MAVSSPVEFRLASTNSLGIRPPCLYMRKREARGLNLPFLAAFAFAGHLRACPARLGQPDRNGLLTAGDFLARSAAAERAALTLAHHLLDLLRCLSAVLSTPTLFRHQSSPVWYLATLSQ